jgi:ABC-type nitrate/sulfonate/bicarbonate transport system ATPase subunit
MNIKNLHFQYENNIVFDKLNLKFEDNQINCIVGKSGIGKSTLLKCIAGLLKYKGDILINDEKVNIDDVFMMHQSYTNFPWLTCLDNVLFPIKIKRKINSEDKQQAIDLLNKVGLKNNLNDYPNQLSGGMQQRLALARTLLIQPKILLMDEPLSALDNNTRTQMQNLILDLHNSIHNTIILVTHSEHEAKLLGDKIIKL